MEQKKRFDIKQSGWLLLLVFIIAFLPRVFLCMKTVPVRTLSDELATISGAAYFAGLDWSPVISNAGYYGSGFSALFSPLFKLTDNPFVIYKCMLIGASVLQALIAPISMHLMKKYFKVENRLFLIAGALACSFMVVTRTTIFYNEHMLIFISWTVAWLLCILVNAEGKKEQRIYTAVLMAVLGYALTIHVRALTYWFALVFIVMLYYWTYRKWLVSKSMFLLIGAGGYLLSQRFVDMVQKYIWLAGSGEPIRNDKVTIGFQGELLDLDTWKAWLSIIFGQLNTISAATGGFLILSIVAACCVLWKAVVKRKGNPLFVSVLIFFFLCCGMTIGAQSISWLPNVIQGIQDGYGTKLYGMKAITYVRYFGPYVGPVFLCGLVWLKEKREKGKGYYIWSAGTYVGFIFIWILLILPYIKESFHTMEVFMALAASKRGEADLTKYLIALFVSIIIFMVLSISIWKRKWNFVPVVLALYLMYQYGYDAYYFDAVCAKNSIQLANGGYTLVRELQESGAQAPKELYVEDRREKSDHFTYYEYQILLNRYQIIPGMPEEEVEEAIVFCNRKADPELLQAGYSYAKLDKNEWVYVKGENYSTMLEQHGVRLKHE